MGGMTHPLTSLLIHIHMDFMVLSLTYLSRHAYFSRKVLKIMHQVLMLISPNTFSDCVSISLWNIFCFHEKVFIIAINVSACNWQNIRNWSVFQLSYWFIISDSCFVFHVWSLTLDIRHTSEDSRKTYTMFFPHSNRIGTSCRRCIWSPFRLSTGNDVSVPIL